MADNIPKDYSEYATSGSVWAPENSESSVPDLLGNMHDVANFSTELTTDSPIVSGGLSDSLSLDSLSGTLVKQIELSSPSIRESSDVSPSKSTDMSAFSSDELEASISRIMESRRSPDDLSWSAESYASQNLEDITDTTLSVLPDPPVATYKESRAPDPPVATYTESRAPALQKLDNPLTPLAPIVTPTANLTPPSNTTPYVATENSPAALPNRAGALTRLLDDGLLTDGQAFNWADKLRTGDIDLDSLKHIETLQNSPFLDVLAEDSGPLTRQGATEAIDNQSANREAFARYSLDDVMHKSQQTDTLNRELGAGPYEGPFNQSTLSSIQQIMGEGDWSKVSRSVSGAMSSSLIDKDRSALLGGGPSELIGPAADKYIQSQAEVDPQFKDLDDRLNSMGRQETLSQLGSNAANSVQEKLKAVPPVDAVASLLTSDTVDITPPTNTIDSILTDSKDHPAQPGIASLLDSSAETADRMSVDSGTMDKLESGNQSLGREAAAGNDGELSAKTVVLRGATINVTSEDANIQLTGVDSGPASEATTTAPAVDG